MCAYDALAAAWEMRMAGLSVDARAQRADSREPFFLGKSGRSWCTTDTQQLACRMAVALGLDATQFGGKSFRVGGATDIRDRLGASAINTIKQRGRWWSDIAFIYQRALVTEHLQLSADMADAASRDLEALCGGWAQSAGLR